MRALLVSGPFDRQAANVVHRPPYLVVAECDCIRRGERPCGSRTHWHDPEEAKLHGDLPRDAAWYARAGRTGPRASWCRYLYAGTRPPTSADRRLRATREEQRETALGRELAGLERGEV